MPNQKLTGEVLMNIGFVDIATWEADGDLIVYRLDGGDSDAKQVMLDEPNALYAFVCGEEVLYVGKTARSIGKRFIGYRRPGKTQQTNLRCQRNIKAALAEGAEIRILVFTPISHLRYADFEINLAAGLKDPLIRAFDPPWNGSKRGQPITEEAEREQAQEADTEQRDAVHPDDIQHKAMATPPALATFTVTLGATYYEKGFLNPV
jgi:hypothetical protein